MSGRIPRQSADPAVIPLADAKRRSRFRRALLAWYADGARDLPWRRTRDPYRIWVSEILLQQTQVATARPYYERFVARWPTVSALAGASEQEVLKAWAGLGYYARARRLLEAARLIVHDRGGAWPRRAAQWLELPGVGAYTAAAIASIAWGEPVAAVDGNVQRVLARLYRVDRPVEGVEVKRQLAGYAELLLSRAAPGAFNQAMMELGARVCRPRKPACPACPVRAWCAGRVSGDPERLPARTRRRPVPEVEEVAGVVLRGGKLLLVRRPATGLLGGLWELPGGPVDGQEPRTALLEHLRRGFGLSVQAVVELGCVRHAFSHRKLRLHIFACRGVRGRPRLRRHTAVRWVERGPGPDLPLSGPTRRAWEVPGVGAPGGA